MEKKDNKIDIITIIMAINLIALTACYTFSIIMYIFAGENRTYNSVSDFFSSKCNLILFMVTLIAFIITLIFFVYNLKNEDVGYNTYVCIKKSELNTIHNTIKKQKQEIDLLKKDNKLYK